MQNPPELDVRTIPPPERHPRIFGAFDALAEGESFVLVNDHYPKPLLYQFQSERPGRFRVERARGRAAALSCPDPAPRGRAPAT
ncbi:MAG: DUF2249 domain-containing protein [Sandaracinaceae bacterium]|nr:DUF2249 domain-containing protein [Sandaracinaceae bacterium]